MTKREFEMKSDGLGIGLFAFGVFCAVLVVQAMIKGVEDEPTQFVKVVAAVWVNSIGAFPSLVFNAALAALGARLFLGGALPGLVRHLVGAGFLTASLSILCGAFGATAGGMFGARTGGALADLTHVAVAALIGALAAVATVWFVWIQKDELPEEEPMTVRNPELAVAATGDEGVSNEEAEALLPVAQPLPKPVPPPSPYPEDVRRKGEIPAGTRPLGGAPSAPAIPAAAFAPSVYRWTAPGARQENAPATPVPATFETAEEVETTDDRYTLADEELPAAEARAGTATAQTAGNLPRPVWEEGDEDPIVDAYGTPRSLVESLRKDADDDFVEEVSEARPLVAAQPVDDEDELDEFDDEEPLEASTAVGTTDLDDEDADDEEDDDAELADDDELDTDDELDEELAQELVDDEEELEEELAPAAERLTEPVSATLTERRAPAAPEPVAARAPDAVFHEDEADDQDAEPADERRAALREELRSLTFVTETDDAAEETSVEDELARAVRALDADDAEDETNAAATDAVRVTVSEFAAGVEAPRTEEVVERALAMPETELAPESVLEDDASSEDEEGLELEAELDSEEELEEEFEAEELATATLDADELDHDDARELELEPAASVEASDPAESSDGPSKVQAASEVEPSAVSNAPVEAELASAAAANAVSDVLAAPESRSNGRKAAKVEAPSLFDGPAEDDEPASSVFETADEPAPKRKSARRNSSPEPVLAAAEAALTETEPQVILTPHAVPAELTLKTPTGSSSIERTALLAEVGCLFIDRGRVAVSILQRQYSMEFDDACKVLDELQDMGLIGPYLGGQRRDILLSREAWLEKVGVS